MKRILGRIISDIRAARYIDTYIAFVLALVFVAIDVVNGFGKNKSTLDTFYRATLIILIASVGLAIVELRRDVRGSNKASYGPIWRFFPDRDALHREDPLEQRIAECTKEVEIIGIQLAAILRLTGTLEECAESKVRVKVAVLGPVDKQGEALPWLSEFGTVHTYPNLDHILRVTTVPELQGWYEGLPEKQKKYVELRAYTAIPTASIMFFDRTTRNGYIHVEPILHKFRPNERPTWWIRKLDNKKLFDLLVDRYADLWDHAYPLADIVLDGKKVGTN